MGRVYVNNREYIGKKIYESADYRLFVLNEIYEKFLFLRCENGHTKDFTLTGIGKANDLIRLIVTKSEEQVRKELRNRYYQFMEEKTTQKIEDEDKKMSLFFDEHYVHFLYLGIGFKKFMTQFRYE